MDKTLTLQERRLMGEADTDNKDSVGSAAAQLGEQRTHELSVRHRHPGGAVMGATRKILRMCLFPPLATPPRYEL